MIHILQYFNKNFQSLDQSDFIRTPSDAPWKKYIREELKESPCFKPPSPSGSKWRAISNCDLCHCTRNCKASAITSKNITSLNKEVNFERYDCQTPEIKIEETEDSSVAGNNGGLDTTNDVKTEMLDNIEIKHEKIE